MSLRSLSTGKQYKNVYTILEKVKKGEIKSYYDNEDKGLFGKINFYKKPDLVKPYLHYLDESRLSSIMQTQMSSHSMTDVMKECYKDLLANPEYRKWRDTKNGNSDIDQSRFLKEIRAIYSKFPSHLQNDIFNMYYNKIDNVEFTERTDANYTKYKFLEKSNNPVGKIMSENSHLKSAIFMRNVMMYYLTKMALLKLTDPEGANQLQKSLDDGSGFDNPEIDKLFNKQFESSNSSKLMNKLMDDASNVCKKMDEAMDQDTQEEMFKSILQDGGQGAAKLDTQYLENVRAKLSNLKMNLGSVKDKIKKLMDKSLSFFSPRKETTYENIFDTDNIAGLEDYELLHPKLRKLFVEDINVKETKPIGKVDIYVDISGSMSDRCGIKNQEGHDVSKLEFAKSFVAKLKQEDLLDDVYIFNGKVKQIKNDLINIALLDTNGGTEIDNVLKKIEKTNKNSIIITDAEDCCSIYSDKAYFIGVNGARFSHFREDIIAEYSKFNQAVVFDGTKIFSVNEKGNTIK